MSTHSFRIDDPRCHEGNRIGREPLLRAVDANALAPAPSAFERGEQGMMANMVLSRYETAVVRG